MKMATMINMKQVTEHNLLPLFIPVPVNISLISCWLRNISMIAHAEILHQHLFDDLH